MCVCVSVCACMFVSVCLVWVTHMICARTRTLLQRLHGGGGLQRDQALSLEVEDVLLLELLHLDQLLLKGQLLTA